ncbi:tyrosine-protein phosphatase non-receptor type 61F isoform X1 [Bradysia coprophila]|uniref:tyrosine-protein phosphatase non-receptor type 61F isoform X1 n=1 Tax=Bradysia coprophila TaxID=38358 RepID=UPI00187D902E|nr:tyrosine-protein phosphatase non-receptor type 61F isoform X1 [Bradysia coprophila]
MTKSSICTEYNEINENGRNGWMDKFQSIKEKSEQEAKEKKFSFDVANKADNRRFNRYRDVNPYDHSRIVLHRGDVDYINANLVTMDKANRKYILTQGPLQNTVGHFWLMVWEQNSKAILMLNKIIEKKQVKCHQYWPEKKGPEHKLSLTDVGLEVEYLRSEEYKHYTKRILRLSDTESTKSREIIQFHYNTWPDFGIPSSPIEFLQFLKQVRDSNALSADVGPAIVHCSAGIGRSGTFCLVDTCLVLVENDGENKVSVCDLLLELRRYRMGLIQTFDQLFFSYQAIIDGIKHLNDPSFSDYEEVPVISYNEEDVPPPLPPPRDSSLQLKGTPVIPTSASAHEFRDVEKRKNAENNIDRPLPPLPRENSLPKLDESGSDEIEEDDSDVYEDDDSVSGNDAPVNDHDENIVKTTNGYSDESSFDANATLPLSPSEKATMNGTGERSEASELRRRQRLEKQSAMANKVKEMKRKQQACEEEAGKPKKRRSMMITIGAGVGLVVCLFCVYYSYTKLG